MSYPPGYFDAWGPEPPAPEQPPANPYGWLTAEEWRGTDTATEDVERKPAEVATLPWHVCDWLMWI
jgi:hypothetical protein